MKKFKSTKRAIKRGHLKHVVTAHPNKENFYYVHLMRRSNSGEFNTVYQYLGLKYIKKEEIENLN